jgi:hypothetical protein
MADYVLTPEVLARHIFLQTYHRYFEKHFHTSRDLIVTALKPRRQWSKSGYVALLKAYQRHQFQQKLFALEHPDLHEQFVKVIEVIQLVVDGPPVSVPQDISEPGGTGSLISPGYIESLIAQYLPRTEELDH